MGKIEGVLYMGGGGYHNNLYTDSGGIIGKIIIVLIQAEIHEK